MAITHFQLNTKQYIEQLLKHLNSCKKISKALIKTDFVKEMSSLTYHSLPNFDCSGS